MDKADAVIAVFADHNAAEGAVKALTAAGFEMKNLSVVGKGYQIDEKVVGFYNEGDRIKFWGTRVRSGAAFGACSLAGCSCPFPLWGMSSCLDTWPQWRPTALQMPSWLAG